MSSLVHRPSSPSPLRRPGDEASRCLRALNTKRGSHGHGYRGWNAGISLGLPPMIRTDTQNFTILTMPLYGNGIRYKASFNIPEVEHSTTLTVDDSPNFAWEVGRWMAKADRPGRSSSCSHYQIWILDSIWLKWDRIAPAIEFTGTRTLHLVCTYYGVQ